MTAVKLRSNGTGKQVHYMIGIPATIGKHAVDAGITAFEIKPTDEGLLLIPVHGIDSSPTEELPAWLHTPQSAKNTEN